MATISKCFQNPPICGYLRYLVLGLLKVRKLKKILTALLLLQSQFWRVQQGTLNSAVYYNLTCV